MSCVFLVSNCSTMMFQDPNNQDFHHLFRRFDGFDVLGQIRPILAQRFEDYCLSRNATKPSTVGDHPLIFNFCTDFVTGRLLPRISNTDEGCLVNEIISLYGGQSDHTYLMLALTYHPEKEQFVCPMLSQQCCESFNYWQNIRMREIGEYFDGAIAMVASFEFDQNPEYPPRMKFRPLFLPTSSYQAYKQALDIAHQIKLIRERTNGNPVSNIPLTI